MGKLFRFKKKNTDNWKSDFLRERIVNQYSDLSFYLNLYNEQDSRKKLYTNKEVLLLNDIPLVSVTQSQIINQFGKPDYEYHLKKQFLSIKILLYHKFIGQFKIGMELHLFQNSLFNYKFTFPYTTSKERGELLKMLEQKYLNNISFAYDTSQIIDRNLSSIVIENTLVFSINYNFNDPFVKDKILSYIKENEADREIDALLNSVELYKLI